MKVNDEWIKPKNLILRDGTVSFTDFDVSNDGTITMDSGIQNLDLFFDPIGNVESVKLDVMKTDAPNGNAILTEIEIYE